MTRLVVLAVAAAAAAVTVAPAAADQPCAPGFRPVHVTARQYACVPDPDVFACSPSLPPVC